MISQSRINTYINCSKKYYWKYVKNIKPSNDIRIDGLFIGQYVHKAIENYIKTNTYTNVYVLYEIIQNWEALYNELWSSEKKIYEFEDLEKLKEYCKKYMKPDYYTSIFENEIEKLKTKDNIIFGLYETADRISRQVIQEIDNGLLSDIISYQSETQITHENLQGYTDIIGINNDFQKIIIDFNTSKRDYEFKKKIQDLLYCYIIQKTTGEIPIFRYIAIKYNNKNEVIIEITQQDFEYTEKELEQIEEYIDAFQKGISNNVFLRNENSYLCSQDFCEYYNICMLQKGGAL